MMTASADHRSRPAGSCSAAREVPVRPKGRRAPQSAASTSAAMDPAKAAVAADVLAVLAAFGLEDRPAPKA